MSLAFGLLVGVLADPKLCNATRESAGVGVSLKGKRGIAIRTTPNVFRGRAFWEKRELQTNDRGENTIFKSMVDVRHESQLPKTPEALIAGAK